MATKNSGSHVGPSDVNLSRPNQFPGVHLVIYINMNNAYKKIEHPVYHKNNDVIILRISYTCVLVKSREISLLTQDHTRPDNHTDKAW